ncbi:putative transcription factor interactor and regulator CCHC(Zn) family [Helianthus annuus]|nr:putative transcription factor interactor and regulator CCHC(Zn) family [Helianthus annuus]
MKRNERTNNVSSYERFKSLPNEKLNDTYQRFTKLLNELKKFGITKSNDERNIKFLDALPREWRSLTMTLSSTLELGNMSLHDLYSILIPREEEIFEETIQRGGSLALISNSQRQTTSNDPQPSSSQAFETSDSSSDFSAFADAIALLTKTFEQRLRGGGHRYQRSDRRRMDNRSKEDVRSKDKGKAEVVCYKCKQRGHYASECKTKKLKDVAYYERKLEEAKKQQQQVSLIAGTDTWLSDDSSDEEEEEEEEEMANFCLMALSDDIPETSGQQDHHVQQIWYCDSGSSKHMTGDRSLLSNFVPKAG